MANIKIYEMVTERIVALLDKGIVPWHKPWAVQGTACNLISKKAYRGINSFMLNYNGYNSPYYVSYKQAKTLGGQVRKGAKGHPIIFWKFLQRIEKNTDGEDKKYNIPLLRYYTVFNVEQCEGIPAGKIPTLEPKVFNPIEEAEAVINNMPACPDIKHGGDKAYYSPIMDNVGMPKRKYFDSEQEYYSVLFHELVHSTGHDKRLGRHKKQNCSHSFGSESYSKEELVAEMGACFLAGTVGFVENIIKNSAAYIGGWRSKLINDPKLLIGAGGAAQKASDFILDQQFNPDDKGGYNGRL